MTLIKSRFLQYTLLLAVLSDLWNHHSRTSPLPPLFRQKQSVVHRSILHIWDPQVHNCTQLLAPNASSFLLQKINRLCTFFPNVVFQFLPSAHLAIILASSIAVASSQVHELLCLLPLLCSINDVPFSVPFRVLLLFPSAHSFLHTVPFQSLLWVPNQSWWSKCWWVSCMVFRKRSSE